MTVTRTTPRRRVPAKAHASIASKEASEQDFAEIVEEVRKLLATVSVYRQLVDRLLAERAA